MSEGESIRFPQQAVFDQAAGTISSGHDPLGGVPDQIAELGLPALLVGMWPTGLELVAALGAAFDVATLAHQNHSASVQSAIKAISESGKNYHKAEQQNYTVISHLRSSVPSSPDVQA